MAIIKLNATRGLEGTLPAVSGANLTGISAGKVLQVVSTKKTDTFGTSSETHVDVTGLTANITPSATANKVFVMNLVLVFVEDQMMVDTINSVQ